MYDIINFYHFFSFPPSAQEQVTRDLRELTQRDPSLGGLVLLSDEGINLSVASTGEGTSLVLACCAAVTDLSGTLVKRHQSPHSPFRRFTIDRRAELITYRGEQSRNHPDLFAGLPETQLSPQEWHDIIGSGEPITIIDTRNDYEVALGSFRGALNPQIKHFSDLVPWLEDNPPPRDKKVLLFCTGGVRCEKVTIDLRDRGYDKVYQLHGGILSYLEQYPDGYFNGECFVFDHRVAVDQQLRPSTKHHLCRLCGEPTMNERRCDYCDSSTPVCEECISRNGVVACSKNCLYHAQGRGRARHSSPSIAQS